MPTVDPYSKPHPAVPAPPARTAAEVANEQAAQLLTHFIAAQPQPDGYVAGRGMPDGSDIPKPSGLYTHALIGPTTWPTESENDFRAASTEWKTFQQRHEGAAESAKSLCDNVFACTWTAGDGADAAREHYGDQYRKHLSVIDVAEAGSGAYRRLGNDVERTKRLIRDAHDAAHKDIEAYLQAPGGKSIATIGAIIAPYRTLIDSYSSDLRLRDAAETAGLTKRFGPLPESPGEKGETHGVDNSSADTQQETDIDKRPGIHGADESSGEGNSDLQAGGSATTEVAGPLDHGVPGTDATGQTVHGADLSEGLPIEAAGGAAESTATATTGAAAELSPHTAEGIHGADLSEGSPTALGSTLATPAVPRPLSTGGSSLGGMGPGSGVSPGLLGRAADPVSNLGGSVTGLPGGEAVGGGGAVPGSPLPSAAAPAVSSLGEFGRGAAAGSGAAGAVPSLGAAPSSVPQTPRAPLAAPIMQGTPGAAAPAAVSGAVGLPGAGAAAVGAGAGGVPVAAPAGAAAPAAVTPVPGSPSGPVMPPMTPYSSVLPSAAAPAAAMGGGPSIAGAPPPPPITGGAGSTAPGFVPVREQGSPLRIAREVSLTDLEVARAAVADLAAASSVVYPGLEWAVVVSRSSAGTPDLWVTSNEGAGYIPAGVYVRRTMPLARGDDAFDARWFGWFDPAETAVRAVQARGGTVSAVATSWARPSELVAEATREVAIAVAPSSGPGAAEASELLASRSHRLETVAPSVYHALKAADRTVAESYARQMTQAVAFGGPELSAVAQSVARAVISSRRPSAEEWAALRAEFERNRLIAGSQRPGLQGVEQPEQRAAYALDFVRCRRLETLLCWVEDSESSLADVVYAAAMAGAVLPPVAVRV